MITGKPDSQMIMTGAFAIGGFTGAVLMMVLALVIGSCVANKPCLPKDCSQEVQELQNTVKRQENTIKRLEVYEQAVRWGKKK